jgi:uncharacterized membrane protein YidH (DUF202 family)
MNFTNLQIQSRSHLPQGYRQGLITAITVILGFSLAFMRYWALENTNDWTSKGKISASIVGIGILVLLWTLYRSLDIHDDNHRRYPRTVKYFFVGVAIVVVGVFYSIIVAA